MSNDLCLDLDSPLDASEIALASGGKVFSHFSPDISNSQLHSQGLDVNSRDLAYEISEGVYEALSAVRARAPLVFVSGRAGTGKSRLIRYMKSLPEGLRQVVVAPTGIAALSLGASTIHSMFKLPVGVIDAESLSREAPLRSQVIRKMTRLVIDEVSMVRADMLDGIDVRLRTARDDDRPFGGVQVVLVGDFLQLPPVVADNDRELMERLGYETPFAFSSRVMGRSPVCVATLSKVWRQSDPSMIKALGAIREGRNYLGAIEWLNERCAGEHRDGSAPLLLTSTRAAADHYNEKGLRLLSETGKGSPADFASLATGDFEKEHAPLPAPRQLTLMIGARVMAVRNDPAGSFVNGSLGEVVGLSDERDGIVMAFVDVLFDGAPNPVRIRPASWSKTRQVWDEAAEAIVETVTGTFDQIPLIVGYAITIHKSQGLSLTDVRVDLGRGAFAPGQLYVALSRARCVEGLSLARPIEARDVKVDDMLIRFLEWVDQKQDIEFQSA